MRRMQVDLAIMTSVFRRDLRIFDNAMFKTRQAFPDSHICVWVDDRTGDPYVDLYADDDKVHFGVGSAIDALPDCYHINEHKNPAWAMNRCLELVKQKCNPEWVLLLSSDVMVSPAFRFAMQTATGPEALWCPRVVDMDTNQVFCSTDKLWPMNWCLLTKLAWLDAAGGWDEELMNGMAFDDNDLSGRLMQQAGMLMMDDRVTAYHQTHEQVAYSDDWKGFKINEAYMHDKWKADCVPFNRTDKPVKVYELALHRTEGGNLAMWKLGNE